MADLSIGIRIGAALAGSFSSAFAGARGTLGQLGQVADQLRARHARLGEAMARAASHPARNVDALRRQYEQLGRTINRLQAQQERLSASMTRGAALGAQRAELRGQAMGTLFAGAAMAMPVGKAVAVSAKYQDALNAIAITGDMTRNQEQHLGQTIRAAALRYNQGQLDIAQGVAFLVAEGMKPEKAENQASLLAKTATASRATFEDLAKMNVSFDLLGVKDMGLAFDQATKAGKQGAFEMRDMAKWFPVLGGMMKSVGVQGNEAVVNMAARLQISRRTAGSNDEAGNNFKNFLSKLTAPDTAKDFEKLGVDLSGSLKRMARDGQDPIEGGIGIIMAKMKDSAPGAAMELQKLAEAMAKIKDPAERAAEMERRKGFIESIGQRVGIGQMFQDMQAMSYLLAELQNRPALKTIMNETRTGKGIAGKSQIDEDFAKRMESPVEKFKKLKISLGELGIVIGDILLPPLGELSDQLKGMVDSFGQWAKAHPSVIKGVVGLASGLLASKLAFIGLKYGINLVLSPFNALGTAWHTLASKWILLRGLWQVGYFAPLLLKVRTLATLLGGRLVSGIMLAGRAVLWLGRALMMNPIGLAITAIALSAYLIYRYWDKIKPWFANLWAGVKAIFTSAADWMKGITTSFAGFGAHIIDGLVNGIKSKFGEAKATIIEFGQNLKGWFADTLGIKSPSRVFLGFGDNIAQGAALGIGRSAVFATRAVASMAQASATAWGKPELASPFVDVANRVASVVPRASGHEGPNSSGGMTVHFSPQITVQGGDSAAVQGQVNQALQASYPEFERMMKRYESKRGSYGRNV